MRVQQFDTCGESPPPNYRPLEWGSKSSEPPNVARSRPNRGAGLLCWKEVPGGVAPLGHGKREGPAGDKFLRSKDAGNGGRVRSGA